jgi:hypothetical protein
MVREEDLPTVPAHPDVEPGFERDFEAGAEPGLEAALDAVLEALTRTGWQDADSAAPDSPDVQRLVTVAAGLRQAFAASPSPQASRRHRALISHAARGLHTPTSPVQVL